MSGGVNKFGGILAAFIGFAAFAPSTMIKAEQAPAARFARLPSPAVTDPKLFVPPFTAPAYDVGKLDPGKFHKEVPEISFDTIDLGLSQLRVEMADIATRPIPDTPDLTDVIVPARPGKKRSSPRYFGFTLSAPTH